jgi:release factor glutamine methyltransferase
MLNGKELFHYIWNNLEDDFEENEKKAICRSILFDLAKFKMPWNLEKGITPGLIQKIDSAILRINNGEPTQYVCGLAPFRNYLFYVNNKVLIPRPETEELVSLVLEHLNFLPAGKGLDIGTGSGAIAIAIALESSREIDATDISEDALIVARENIEKFRVKVNPIQIDILENPIKESYSFIVSNPPYICEAEKEEISSSVIHFEPHIALFVPDKYPLLFYEKITEKAFKALLPNGALFFECHYKYADQVADLMVGLSFSKVQIRNDLNGKQRMVFGFKSQK